MTIRFIIIQLLGFISWLFLITSYHRKNTNQILLFQIISCTIYCTHYYLLQAYSGLFICFLETIIGYLYYKTDLDNYIYLISIPLYISFYLFNYTGIISILPLIAALIDGYALTKKKKTIIILSIISYSLWVIYNIYVKSYIGAITDSLIILSNTIIILKELKIIKKKHKYLDKAIYFLKENESKN